MVTRTRDVKVKAGLDAKIAPRPDARPLRAKSGLRAGRLAANHNLRVKTGLKAGRLAANHNLRVLRVKSGLKAGKISANHNGSLKGTRARK
jgi:hypothetical protein